MQNRETDRKVGILQGHQIAKWRGGGGGGKEKQGNREMERKRDM